MVRLNLNNSNNIFLRYDAALEANQSLSILTSAFPKCNLFNISLTFRALSLRLEQRKNTISGGLHLPLNHQQVLFFKKSTLIGKL